MVVVVVWWLGIDTVVLGRGFGGGVVVLVVVLFGGGCVSDTYGDGRPAVCGKRKREYSEYAREGSCPGGGDGARGRGDGGLFVAGEGVLCRWCGGFGSRQLWVLLKIVFVGVQAGVMSWSLFWRLVDNGICDVLVRWSAGRDMVPRGLTKDFATELEALHMSSPDTVGVLRVKLVKLVIWIRYSFESFRNRTRGLNH